MKRLVALMMCAVSLGVAAQISSNVPQLPVEARLSKDYKTQSKTGFETTVSSPQDLPAIQESIANDVYNGAEVIGITQYDLQTNASVDDRVWHNSTEFTAAWTMSLDVTPFEDRGTGYNSFTNGNWDEQPFERIENVRTGWPSLIQLGDGREVVISHAGIDTPLHMVRRDAGTGMWEDSDLPNYAILDDGNPVGNLWPRAAVGGINDEIIHVICTSTPVANGGFEYQGQDGALLYYRSMDSGDTWEMTTFPELDSSNFVNISADAYSIHADGGMVAFAVFNDLSDSFIMISDDAGDNWEYQVLADFPVDMYTIDDGLPDSLGIDFDGDGVAAEYLNSDGSGDVLVEANGTVHCVYGAMYYADTNTFDANFQFFPGTNGLQYWRDDFGPDSSVTIAYAEDLDGNGMINLEDEIAAYYVNLASMPSIGSDEDGNLYVSYSAVMETYSTGLQNFRHVYVVNSQDGGDNWNSDSACNLTTGYVGNGYSECVFASLPPRIGDTLEVIFQKDVEPGLHVRGDGDPIDINEIIAVRIPIGDSCPVLDIYGCTIDIACNFDPNATIDDGSCIFTCPGCTEAGACNFDPDANLNDGTCDYFTCAGCTDESACNWDVDAILEDGSCLYVDVCGICGGPGAIYECGCEGVAEGYCDCDFNVLDECGVCAGDDSSCTGCTYPSACNYDPNATILDATECVFGECGGCLDAAACNYNPTVAFDDGSCAYTFDALGVCGGDCLADVNGNGICDIEEACLGEFDECGVCEGPGAIYACGCNDIPQGDCDCLGNAVDAIGVCGGACNADLNGDGICDGISGCTYEIASNFNPSATEDDGSCLFDTVVDDCGLFHDSDGDGLVGTNDLLSLLTEYNLSCD